MTSREMAIRAYLGDQIAQDKIGVGGSITNELLDGILLLDIDFRTEADSLIRSMMKTVRQNVEMLVLQLRNDGYLFESKTPYTPPGPDVSKELDHFEQTTKLFVPLIFRCWLEIVGEVTLMGTHPSWPKITYNGLGGETGAAVVDPLYVVWTADFGLCSWNELLKDIDNPYEHFRIEFAPDPGHKANYSSSGSYNLPATQHPSIDALVTDDDSPSSVPKITFLQHIRLSFQHAGFPGWQRYPDAPHESLQKLGNGLITF
ncbi:hypothetical protein BH11PLA2_BH11PLA2_51280 [soil metagenome]